MHQLSASDGGKHIAYLCLQKECCAWSEEWLLTDSVSHGREIVFQGEQENRLCFLAEASTAVKPDNRHTFYQTSLSQVYFLLWSLETHNVRKHQRGYCSRFDAWIHIQNFITSPYTELHYKPFVICLSNSCHILPWGKHCFHNWHTLQSLYFLFISLFVANSFLDGFLLVKLPKTCCKALFALHDKERKWIGAWQERESFSLSSIISPKLQVTSAEIKRPTKPCLD